MDGSSDINQGLSDVQKDIGRSFWTGLNANGTVSSSNCNNWTSGSSSSRGYTGNSGVVDDTRFYSYNEECWTGGYKILCVSF